MAEETKETKETSSAPAAKKSSKPKRTAKKKAKPKAAAKAAPTKRVEALATERPAPVAPQKKTSQYVVTVDNQTGMTVKIERLDEDTGKRKELSKEEYGQAMAYAGLSSYPQFAGAGQDVSASEGDAEALVQAYYRGIADYFNALTSNE